ncbi:MAG: chorismate synthase [Chloroflexota bacterium]
MSNTLGTLFTVTSFGESHGPSVGVVIDGCPAGVRLEMDEVQRDLDRRSPGVAPGSTPRREPDAVRVLSGLLDGATTGAPVCMLVENRGADSSAYAGLANTPRPGHADYPARLKYGGMNDPRGGGRFSGRVTAGFVMAGALAKAALKSMGTDVFAYTTAIGGVYASECEPSTARVRCRGNSLSCCDDAAATRMEQVIEEARAAGDSVGGLIECVATGLPVGIGEPVFATVDGEIARALFSIPAVKGIEWGAGFKLADMNGSESNDPFIVRDGMVRTAKNDMGGVLGGLTSGEPLVLRVAMKPAPSIAQKQQTVDMATMGPAELEIRGRHDACIVPRAVVVVEAMVAIVLVDLALQAGFLSRVVK